MDLLLRNCNRTAKMGGVFVRFSYNTTNDDGALAEIESDLKSHVRSHGGMPSWTGLKGGDLWLVQGKPWLEVWAPI